MSFGVEVLDGDVFVEEEVGDRGVVVGHLHLGGKEHVEHLFEYSQELVDVVLVQLEVLLLDHVVAGVHVGDVEVHGVQDLAEFYEEVLEDGRHLDQVLVELLEKGLLLLFDTLQLVNFEFLLSVVGVLELVLASQFVLVGVDLFPDGQVLEVVVVDLLGQTVGILIQLVILFLRLDECARDLVYVHDARDVFDLVERLFDDRHVLAVRFDHLHLLLVVLKILHYDLRR